MSSPLNVLLLYPRFPQTFWSFDRFVELADLKATIPPLGIITVAALLPQEWNLRFVDRNVSCDTDDDWEWCDLVIVSAMMVQKPDFHNVIRKAVRLGKKVAVGGPYPTSLPDEASSTGAHYLVLDEGEITLPLFIEAIEQGQEQGVFRALDKPDVTLSPIPRFDLLQRDKYFMMAVQFSRGCPFNCEFCDIITLYGRKPRTKEPEQLLAELQTIYDLGWRGPLVIVDDNFIGNQRNVKRLLRSLIIWMQQHRYPFSFWTEASVNLAEDDELLDLMSQAGFNAVFLGIETPDQDSLKVTQKYQNTRHPLVEACHKINQAGLMINAGFILGFDGEKSGAGQRIQDFVEATSIPQAMLGILQAIPNTALWNRLEQEQRLIKGTGGEEFGDQNTLMNFTPTRPIEEVAKEYLETLWNLYDPQNYLKRCFEHCLQIKANPRLGLLTAFPAGKTLQLVKRVFLRQGWDRPELRSQFWQQFWALLKANPRCLHLYLGLCAAGEHFREYRVLARERITAQLGFDPLKTAQAPGKEVTKLDRTLSSIGK